MFPRQEYTPADWMSVRGWNPSTLAVIDGNKGGQIAPLRYHEHQVTTRSLPLVILGQPLPYSVRLNPHNRVLLRIKVWPAAEGVHRDGVLGNDRFAFEILVADKLKEASWVRPGGEDA
jgi:hypothetical protein